MDRTQLNSIWAQMKSFREHLPTGDLEEKYVAMYHQYLRQLSNLTDYDLTDYFIPDDEVRRRWEGSGYNPETFQQEVFYSKESSCDREFLMMKLDAVLMFFLFEEQMPEKRPIGFNT